MNKTKTKTTKRGKIMERAGFCPVCSSEDLSYKDSYPAGIEFIFEWECHGCGAAGSEVYKLNFTEHIVKYDPTAGPKD